MNYYVVMGYFYQCNGIADYEIGVRKTKEIFEELDKIDHFTVIKKCDNHLEAQNVIDKIQEKEAKRLIELINQ